MDNTIFSGMTTEITGVMNLALTAVVAVCVIALGATVGYRLYKKFMA